MKLVTAVRIATYVVALACLVYIAACENGYHCEDTEFTKVYRCTRGDDVTYYDESGYHVDYAALDADEAEPDTSDSYR